MLAEGEGDDLKPVGQQPGHKAGNKQPKKRGFRWKSAIAPIIQTAETVVDFVVIIALQVQLFYVVVHVNGYF